MPTTESIMSNNKDREEATFKKFIAEWRIQTADIEKRLGIPAITEFKPMMMEDMKISFLGVIHYTEILSKYLDKINEFISKNNGDIALEGIYLDSPTQIDSLNKLTKFIKEKSRTNKDILKYLYVHRKELAKSYPSSISLNFQTSQVFFNTIAALGASAKKDVVFIDTGNNNLSSEINSVLAFLIGLGSNAPLFYNLLVSNKQITRRDMLKIIPLSIAGVSISSYLVFINNFFHKEATRKALKDIDRQINLMEKNNLIDPTSEIPEKLSSWKRYQVEWRDATIALAIEHLSKKKQASLNVIYGTTHSYHLPDYLKDVEKTKARLKLYPELNTLNNPVIKKYHFDKQSGWHLISTEKVLSVD